MGWVKLNTNGSFREEECCMGGGGLLRDSTSKLLSEFQWREVGGYPFLADASTLREGLRLASTNGHREIRCEVHCQDLVRIISSTYT